MLFGLWFHGPIPLVGFVEKAGYIILQTRP